jgi:RNA polymerase sigma factor (sigma-70 family)
MLKGKDHFPDEKKIWRDFKNGSIKEFEWIYDKYFSILYGYGCHICADKALVKDCIQNLFVYLWRNKENLAEVSSIKYYLYKCVRRSIINELEKEHKIHFEDITEDYHFETTVSHEFTLIASQISDEKKNRLLKSFDSLSKRQKEAIFLRFYENMDYQEIASIMSLKEVKYARTLIYRAIEVLKQSNTKEVFH